MNPVVTFIGSRFKAKLAVPAKSRAQYYKIQENANNIEHANLSRRNSYFNLPVKDGSTNGAFWSTLWISWPGQIKIDSTVDG